MTAPGTARHAREIRRLANGIETDMDTLRRELRDYVKALPADSGGGGIEPPPAGAVVELGVTTANIKNRKDLPPAKQQADAAKASRMGGEPLRIVGYQEIGLGKGRRDEKGVRAGQPDGWDLAGPKKLMTTPIGVSPGIDVVDEGWHLLSDDPGKELPGQSERGVTWAHLSVAGLPLLAANTHLINGTWAASKNKHDVRLRYWNQAIDNLASLVDDWTADGLSVLLTGDWNRRKGAGGNWSWSDWFTNPTEVHHQGLDHIVFVPGRGKSATQLRNVKGREVIDGKQNHTDHPFVHATLVLESPAAS